MQVNLKLIQTFLLVAELGGFGRAAAKAGRSQSAISVQIQQLEDQLGVSLFTRTTRRVELTEDGERLLAFAKVAIGTMQEGLEEIRSRVERELEHLRVACAPTIAATHLPHILLAFRARNPSVTVEVRELPALEMEQALRARDVDLGIGPAFGSDASEFRFRSILVDELCVVLPRADMHHEGEVSMRMLALMPIAVLTSYANLRSLLDEGARIAGVKLDVRYEVQQVQTQVAFAKAGLCAVVVPRIALPEDRELHARAFPISDPSITRQIGTITPVGERLRRNGQRFAELASTTLRQIDRR